MRTLNTKVLSRFQGCGIVVDETLKKVRMTVNGKIKANEKSREWRG